MYIYYTPSRPDAFIDTGLESEVITAYGHKEIGVDRLHLYTQEAVYVDHDVAYIDTGILLHIPKPVLFVVRSLDHNLVVQQRIRTHGLLFYEIVHLFVGIRSRVPMTVPPHTLIAEVQGYSFSQRVYFVYNRFLNNHDKPNGG